MFLKDKEKSDQDIWYKKDVLWGKNVEFCLKGLMFIELMDAFTIFIYVMTSKDLNIYYIFFWWVVIFSQALLISDKTNNT